MYLNDIKDDELLEAEKEIQRKLAFSSDNLVVDDAEELLIVILLNYSQSAKNRASLLCRDSAQKIIKDHKHMICCAKQMFYAHTHNLKYPDARVSLQRIVAPPPSTQASFLSSANVERRYGWSYNSSYFNAARFFFSEFFWQKKRETLFCLIKRKELLWVKLFLKLGMTKKTLAEIDNIFSDNPLVTCFPGIISRFSPQLRFTLDNRELCLTPVVSHAVLLEVKKCLDKGSLPSLVINHERPTNIGNFIGSTGGAQSVIKQTPLIKTKKTSFTQSRVKAEARGQLLNNYAIKGEKFSSLLNQLVKLNKTYTKEIRNHLFSQFQDALTQWLIPVIEWRWHLKKESRLAHNLELSPLIDKLLFADDLTEKFIINNLFKHFHRVLSETGKTSFYAYHPKLTNLVKGNIRTVLSRFDSGAHLSSHGSRNFIHLQKIRITRCNALSNPYVFGIPSLTALYGFMTNFARRLDKLFPYTIWFERIAWFIHRYHGYVSQQLPEVSRRKRDNKIVSPLTLGSGSCDLEIDLIIHIPDQICKKDFLEKIDLVKAAMPIHFSGGVIQPPPLDSRINWLSVVDEDTLYDSLSRLPHSGCWVAPTKRILKSFDHAIELITKNKQYRFVNTAFTFLEEPTVRECSLSSLHVYAEPGLGLVECINPIEFRKLGMRDFREKAFWSLFTDNNSVRMQRSAWN